MTIQGEILTAQQQAETSFQTFDGAMQGMQQDAETGLDAGRRFEVPMPLAAATRDLIRLIVERFGERSGQKLEDQR